MPGFELIGKEEQEEISQFLDKIKIMINPQKQRTRIMKKEVFFVRVV